MYYSPQFSARIQAPFVLAEVRALESSIFSSRPEVTRALEIASDVRKRHPLDRSDLFVPARDTFGAVLEPLMAPGLVGTVRRIGREIFPQYLEILGVPPEGAQAALRISSFGGLVAHVCHAYSQCVVGPGAGSLRARIIAPRHAVVEDTSFMPCTLQEGVFTSAGDLTGFPHQFVHDECRRRGAKQCVYQLHAA